MPTLTDQDLRYVVGSLPADIIALAQKHSVIIAGGFIRETISRGEVKDIDIFGSDLGKLQRAASDLKASREAKLFESRNAITILAPPRVPVQFITRWFFKDLKECADSFDFTVCQAAIWYNSRHNRFSWESFVPDTFYSDLAAKRLVYTRPKRNEDAGGSMIRVQKFIKRGYTIQSESLAAVMARMVCALKFSRSTMYDNEYRVSRALKALLLEVDPLRVIDGFDLVDEHRAILEQSAKELVI